MKNLDYKTSSRISRNGQLYIPPEILKLLNCELNTSGVMEFWEDKDKNIIIKVKSDEVVRAIYKKND